VFIVINDEKIDAVHLVTHMAMEVQTTRKLNTRYCIRLEPFLKTCYSDPEELEALVEEVLPPAIAKFADGTRYVVEFKRRGLPNKIARDDTIRMIASKMPRDRNIRVDSKSATVVVLVHSVSTFTGFSVIPNYVQLLRFNLRNLVLDQENFLKEKSKNKRPPKEITTEKKEEQGQPPVANTEEVQKVRTHDTESINSKTHSTISVAIDSDPS